MSSISESNLQSCIVSIMGIRAMLYESLENSDISPYKGLSVCGLCISLSIKRKWPVIRKRNINIWIFTDIEGLYECIPRPCDRSPRDLSEKIGTPEIVISWCFFLISSIDINLFYLSLFLLAKPEALTLVRRNCFSVRVINKWNPLPEWVISLRNVNALNSLDKLGGADIRCNALSIRSMWVALEPVVPELYHRPESL